MSGPATYDSVPGFRRVPAPHTQSAERAAHDGADTPAVYLRLEMKGLHIGGVNIDELEVAGDADSVMRVWSMLVGP